MSSAFSRNRGRFRVLLGIVLAGTALLLGANRPQRPTYHWCVTGAFRDHVDRSGTPIRDDAVMFYEHDFGLLPRFYKGQPERGGVPQAVDMKAHLAKIRADLDASIPDPRWSGYAIIDLETWGPLWEYTGEEAHRMSISIARRNHPERPMHEVERIARANYELGSKALLEATLRECKALRPRARWGFYAWPYPAHAPNMDKLKWLWDSCTAFFPECYTVYKGKEGGKHLEGFAPPAEYLADCQTKVALHRRTAGESRPVIALVWVRYHEINGVFGGEFLESADLERMFRTPIEAGADGLAFWDTIPDDASARTYSRFLREKVAPIMQK